MPHAAAAPVSLYYVVFGDLTPRELACLLAIGATRVEAPEEAAPEGFLGQAAEVRAERLPTGIRCTED